MSRELFQEIEAHNLERVASLLSQGADPNATQDEHPLWTPLHAAIEELDNGGSMEMVRLLLRSGADVNGRDGLNEATPLLMAMFRDNRDAMRLLLEAGADPNDISGEGDSTLRWAVEEGDMDMARLFIDYGAGKTIDKFGGYSRTTPLGLAARKLNIPMMELLLEAGANPDAIDDDYETPLQQLPRREKTDPDAWDRAVELLRRGRQ